MLCVDECDQGASTTRKPRPTRAVNSWGKKLYCILHVNVQSRKGIRFKRVTGNAKQSKYECGLTSSGSGTV